MGIFIDGIPQPKEENAKIATKSGHEDKTKQKEKKIDETQEPNIFFHQPFLEQMCDSCHDLKSPQKLSLKGKELCFTCHDDFTKDKKVIHFPVSEGQCLECHDPHQSKNKYILKKAMPGICFTCHDEKEIKANSAHEDNAICTDCHNVHASNEEKLLK